MNINVKQSAELEQQAALQVAGLMVAAARTAPKTRGIDNIKILALADPAARASLVAKMRELACANNRPSFERDANNIAASPVIVVIGVETNPAGLNCGWCGNANCESLESAHGACAFNAIDLGIAVSSAVGAAANARVDTRVMFSVGQGSLALDLFGGQVRQALGIPLSVTGKSPFFDRK